jgi:hypothetical protein
VPLVVDSSMAYALEVTGTPITWPQLDFVMF